MEEAKDISELKSLLSGMSADNDMRYVPTGSQAKGSDTYAQKIALLKSVSVLFFSLSLFLFFSLLLVLARGYLATSSSERVPQTMAVPDTLKAVPVITEPAPSMSEPSIIASPAVSQPDREEPAPVATSAHQDARTVVLKEEGGSLYFIAIGHYGKADETIYDLILQANPDIVDVRNIDDQQKITLPPITAESYIRGSVQDGYRLYIGTFETSQWTDIYAARVKSTGKDVFIEPRQFSARDTWYRLMIGDFTHKEEALQTVRALAKKGVIYLPPSPGYILQSGCV
jgi:hypothetical protein